VSGAGELPRDQLPQDVVAGLDGPLDELHVAAVLESRGVTDRVARDAHGADDVFALARRLAAPDRPRTGDGPGRSAPAAVAGRPGTWTVRVLAHGPLYVLPSLTYPALSVPLGMPPLVAGLVFATALGWVWGTGLSVAAHHLRGQQRDRAAGRLVRFLLVAGLGLACAGGAVLHRAGVGGPELVGFVVGQLGFQLACGVLLFHGRELWVALLALPAAGTGAVHVASGSPTELVVPTVVTSAVSVAALLGAAWLIGGRSTGRPESQRPVVWRPVRTAAALSAAYGAVCALLLLVTDARHVIGPVDLAIAAAPLVLGAGALEWCAHRFDRSARGLLDSAATPADFARGVRRVFIVELSRAVTVLGALGLTLLGALHWSDRLTTAGAVSVQGHVLLGAVFFTGFVMAAHEQFRALLAVVATGCTAYVVGTTLLLRTAGPTPLVLAFLATCVLLLTAQLVVLRPAIGHLHLYR
jgi:hypothetical protein